MRNGQAVRSENETVKRLFGLPNKYFPVFSPSLIAKIGDRRDQ
jgi:hypothetical protein